MLVAVKFWKIVEGIDYGKISRSVERIDHGKNEASELQRDNSFVNGMISKGHRSNNNNNSKRISYRKLYFELFWRMVIHMHLQLSQVIIERIQFNKRK